MNEKNHLQYSKRSKAKQSKARHRALKKWKEKRPRSQSIANGAFAYNNTEYKHVLRLDSRDQLETRESE